MKDFSLTLAFTLFTISAFCQGLCNQDDLSYMNDNIDALATLSQDCATACLGEDNQEQCVQDCILASSPLSEPCASCFSSQVQCVVENCFITCILGSPADCELCALENCLEDFNACAGIVDLDLDGFTTLNDCDDSNPNVYPDGPGTGENIDNNCDGVIDGDEVLFDICVADFNNNGLVETSDLTELLSVFGCPSNCVIDVDGEPGMLSADLTLFLTIFGSPCQ